MCVCMYVWVDVGRAYVSKWHQALVSQLSLGVAAVCVP